MVFWLVGIAWRSLETCLFHRAEWLVPNSWQSQHTLAANCWRLLLMETLSGERGQCRKGMGLTGKWNLFWDLEMMSHLVNLEVFFISWGLLVWKVSKSGAELSDSMSCLNQALHRVEVIYAILSLFSGCTVICLPYAEHCRGGHRVFCLGASLGHSSRNFKKIHH